MGRGGPETRAEGAIHPDMEARAKGTASQADCLNAQSRGRNRLVREALGYSQRACAQCTGGGEGPSAGLEGWAAAGPCRGKNAAFKPKQ